MTIYNPWSDLRDRYPHIHVERHPIAPAHAFWAVALNVVILDVGLDRASRRCALAHEIAHLDVGDKPTDLCWFAARQETAADKLAARRLVDVGELAYVLSWCFDPREVAAELDVTGPVLAIRWRWMHPAERGVVNLAVSRREAVA